MEGFNNKVLYSTTLILGLFVLIYFIFLLLFKNVSYDSLSVYQGELESLELIENNLYFDIRETTNNNKVRFRVLLSDTENVYDSLTSLTSRNHLLKIKTVDDVTQNSLRAYEISKNDTIISSFETYKQEEEAERNRILAYSLLFLCLFLYFKIKDRKNSKK